MIVFEDFWHNNQEKAKFVPEFLFWLENISVCEARTNIAVAIAQYGLEIFFKYFK